MGREEVHRRGDNHRNDQFALAAKSKDHEPLEGKYKKRLRNTALADFCFDADANGEDTRSLFLRYFEAPPEYSRLLDMPEDAEPRWTERLKEMFRRQALGGAEVKFGMSDEAKFRRASVKLAEFHEQNRDQIFFGPGEGRQTMPELLWAALERDVDGRWDIVSPGWLCSDTMFSRRLPSYLAFQGYFEGAGGSEPEEEYNYLFDEEE